MYLNPVICDNALLPNSTFLCVDIGQAHYKEIAPDEIQYLKKIGVDVLDDSNTEKTAG